MAILKEIKLEIPDLVLPPLYPINPGRDLEEGVLLELQPSKTGLLDVNTSEGGSFKIRKPLDLIKLFPHKYNWTFSRAGEWDCFFKSLSQEESMCLYTLGRLPIGDYTLFYRIGTNCIRLVKGNQASSSRYLVNTAGFTYKQYLCKDMEELRSIVRKLLRLNTLIPVNLLSLASTVKDLVLSERLEEFSTIRGLPMDDIRFLLEGYKGPRQETTVLGTVEGSETLDMTKAYLRALGTCPTLRKKGTLILRDKPYIPEAHPGSVYRVRVSVPSTYSSFPPLPFKTRSLPSGGGIGYPVGDFETTISRPYMDIIKEQGDIKCKILNSLQFVPTTEGQTPFKELTTIIEYCEDSFREELWPVNVKGLHFPMIGHFLHYHWDTEEEIFRTSTDFNPILANAMQGLVSKEVWKLSQVTNTVAIRVDAITGKSLPDREGFKRKLTGVTTFLTPALKDNPGSTTYRDLIHKYRDLKHVVLQFHRRVSFKEAYLDPSRIGNVVSSKVCIPPSGGNRGVPREKVRRIGNLLEKTIPTFIPNLRTLSNYGKDPESKEVPSWIQDHLQQTIVEPM